MHRLLLLLLLTITPLSRAADWPVFRGPTRDGVSAETDWTHQWPGGEPRQLFKVNVHNGFSSPTVVGERLWTMGHTRGNDVVVCLDAATGQEIWTHKYPALSIGTVSPDYEGTRSTPTFDAGQLYTLSRDGKVFRLDAASGKVQWQKDLAKELGLALPPWGFASSAIVHGDLLILNVGAAGLALDKNTGNVKWQTGKATSAYATPLEYTLAGADKSRLAVFTADAVVGLDTQTGQRLWSVPWKTQYKINSVDPIFHDGKLFVSSAYNFGCALVDVSTDKPRTIWQNKELLSHYDPPVLYAGHLYGFSGNNMRGDGLKCLDFATGKALWQTDKPAWGNLIVAGDRLILVTQNCDLIVAAASPDKYQELARAHPLGGTCWTAPVLANGRLYLRNTFGDLVGLDLRKP